MVAGRGLGGEQGADHLDRDRAGLQDGVVEGFVGHAAGVDQLSVGVVRAGSTYSEHRVGIDAPAEVLELVHTARSAVAFADGALAAAAWIAGKKGVFTMDAVAASVLDPLFAGLTGETR